jgi:hypothetical protein
MFYASKYVSSIRRCYKHITFEEMKICLIVRKHGFHAPKWAHYALKGILRRSFFFNFMQQYKK